MLEVDDGTPDGPFKQVYCGSDSICQVNGLSALSTYNARVKAFNQAGFSEYSSIISLAASPSKLLTTKLLIIIFILTLIV